MGKIKKILENELVGGTQTTDVYPVTSIKAVYDENNERLDHILNRRGVVNISTNYNADHTAEVLTLSQAIAKVPSEDRVLGFQGRFLSEDGWKTYTFMGESISDWSNQSKWDSFTNNSEFEQYKSSTESSIGNLKFSGELETNSTYDFGRIYTKRFRIYNVQNSATINGNLLAVQAYKGLSIVSNNSISLTDGAGIDLSEEDIDSIHLYVGGYRVLDGGNLSFTVECNTTLNIRANSENIEELRTYDNIIKGNNESISEVANNVIQFSEHIEKAASHTASVIKYDGSIVQSSNVSQIVYEFDVTGVPIVGVSGRSPGDTNYALASAVDADGNVLQVFKVGKGINYNKTALVLPNGTTSLRVYSESLIPEAFKAPLRIQDVIQVSAEFNTDGLTREEIRLKVSEERRKTGLIITYNYSNMYIIESYNHTSYSDDDFSNSLYWHRILTEYDLAIPSLKDITSTGIDGDYYVLPSQVIGNEIAFGDFGTHTKYTIQANSVAKITTLSGGSYGFALVDSNNKVLEYTSNANTEYTFATYAKETYLFVSKSKTSSVQEVTHSSMVEAIKELQDDVEAIKELSSSNIEELGEEIAVQATYNSYTLSSTGNIVSNTGFNVYEYAVSPNTKVAVTGRSPGNSGYVLAAAYKDTELLMVYFDGTGVTYYDEVITIPEEANLLKVNVPIAITQSVKQVTDAVIPKFYTREEIDRLIGGVNNYWSDKTIWWCGTSIPAGSDATLGSEETIAGNYPTQVGNNLNATVINKAVGGSMCRANVRTGDYNGANFSNITSCLSMTKEEIEDFIANYDSIKGKLTGGAPDSLKQSDLNRLRAASFEDRLLPYLNGTYPMPDLFVLDHGHNDFKYNLSNGQSDIGLEPTIENISSTELAEDSYMTADNNAKLESFFGSLANIPSVQKEAFIASLNRNCYIGAMNFIITLILRYNPHARIVFISNYEYENGDNISYSPLIPAQEELASSWAFPLCRVWQYLGFSNHIIPSSMNWFNSEYPSVTQTSSDVTCFRAYNPDKVHPHSDITGDANAVYAGVISEFIKTCR